MSISQLSFIMLSNTNDLPIGTVVFTGITIVFFVLLLLFIIITIEGVIFTSIENKNKAKTSEAAKTEEPIVKIEVETAQVKSESAPPKVQDGISGEVVAAITAAIAYMQDVDGTNYTISTVTRAKTKKQSAWASSAAAAYTEPF